MDYYKTKDSVDEYIELAKDVNGGELIKKLQKFLPSDSTLLEVGSGPGTDWKILKERYQVIGSDNSREFLHRLITNHPEDTFLELDATTLATDKKFDGIYSNKVLHHLRDNELIESIKNQHSILNPNGVICHSFWKGEGSEIFKGLFVNYHTKDVIKDLLQELFEVLLLEAYEEFEPEDSILLIARKK